MDEFEKFDTKTFVGRLLGRGDWRGFVEKIQVNTMGLQARGFRLCLGGSTLGPAGGTCRRPVLFNSTSTLLAVLQTMLLWKHPCDGCACCKSMMELSQGLHTVKPYSESNAERQQHTDFAEDNLGGLRLSSGYRI